MIVGIPTEIFEGERRVAATPETAKKLIELGLDVVVQRGAGERAFFRDVDYVEAGATLADRDDVWASDLVIKIRPPTLDEVALLAEGGRLMSFIWPAQNDDLIAALPDLT